jgi:uncharacterized membrane protein YjfL (UPF0719 family)
MARRFLLVGLFIVWPFQQGQVMQLSIASLFSIAYLLIQSQAHPYKNHFDNVLALGCSFSLSVLLLCCIFYKYLSLTELEDMQSRMSIELRTDFTVAGALLTYIFIACTFGALGLSVLLLVFKGFAGCLMGRLSSRISWEKGSFTPSCRYAPPLHDAASHFINHAASIMLHQSCCINHAASIMLHQPCCINHAASIMLHQPCCINHAASHA